MHAARVVAALRDNDRGASVGVERLRALAAERDRDKPREH
jgi:hypothetical protein